MLTNLNIYRRQILYLFLVSYVIGAFQSPVFELVHFACHLVNGQALEFQMHSYANHDNLHQHQTLDLVFEKDNFPQNQEIPSVDFDLKKKVEISKIQFQTSFLTKKNTPKQFAYFPSVARNFTDVPHAPPRFS